MREFCEGIAMKVGDSLTDEPCERSDPAVSAEREALGLLSLL